MNDTTFVFILILSIFFLFVICCSGYGKYIDKECAKPNRRMVFQSHDLEPYAFFIMIAALALICHFFGHSSKEEDLRICKQTYQLESTYDKNDAIIHLKDCIKKAGG